MTITTQQDIWWAVARSEEVTDKKPLGINIGDQPVVLWRDKQGIVRALEDRCPHRRAPLSLGCIRDNGWIQCGYHGWSYEGDTGRLKEIPNMKDQQKFPPVYKAIAFSVYEQAGLVRVRSEEHTSELQSLMRISYAVFCLKKKSFRHHHVLTDRD